MVDLRILSLGAGVQSTTLALMIEKGEVPMVDCGIFADTMAEPFNVYTHLDWLKKQVSFPIHIVKFRNLKEDIIEASKGNFKSFHAPFFSKDENGKKGILFRTCTRNYKIEPINKKVRELLGYSKGQRVKKETKVQMLMGISKDEIQRTSRNKLKYIQNEYPLIDLDMRRSNCIEWMEKNNFPKPPRSACTFCPYHSTKEFKDIKENSEKEWQEVLKIDEIIRNNKHPKIHQPLYVHSSCTPLKDIDLNEKQNQQDLFNDICDDGMCGV